MKIIVHFGTPKTGTTSIQYALHKSRKELRGKGILYPKSLRNPVAHHLLSAVFKQEHEFNRGLFLRYGKDFPAIQQEARRNLEMIRKEVRQHRPDILVLSSESFFGFSEPDAMDRFAATLAELEGTLHPAIYVRDPASQYLSALQQWVKGNSVIRPPHPLNVRTRIEAIGRAFGGPFKVQEFSSKALRNADVIQDFNEKFLEGRLDASQIPSERRNETLSAEMTDLVFLYRKWNLAGVDFQRPRNFLQFWETLKTLEKRHSRQNKPQLVPGLRSAITRASTELLWLRDEHGITFDGIDYAAIDGTPIPEIDRYKAPADIILVDREWRDRLLVEAVADLQENPLAAFMWRVRKAIGMG